MGLQATRRYSLPWPGLLFSSAACCHACVCSPVLHLKPCTLYSHGMPMMAMARIAVVCFLAPLLSQLLAGIDR